MDKRAMTDEDAKLYLEADSLVFDEQTHQLIEARYFTRDGRRILFAEMLRWQVI